MCYRYGSGMQKTECEVGSVRCGQLPGICEYIGGEYPLKSVRIELWGLHIKELTPDITNNLHATVVSELR